MSRERPARLRDRDYPEVEGHQAYAIGEDGTRAPAGSAPGAGRSAATEENVPDDVQGHVAEMVRRKEDGERR
jgi:hypothetical protein